MKKLAAWGARPSLYALAELDRHGIRCRCGLTIDRRDAEPARDGWTCVGCRRFIGGLTYAAARGRPVRTLLFGL